MDNVDFVRADSTNLPKVDTIMLMEFMKNSDKHNVAEIRGVKALMSSRQSYVGSAVGYVEVQRSGRICNIKAKVVPEHKLSNKYYNVHIHVDENENTIIDTTCDGCAAAAGGCKHTLVLLYWLEKRSEDGLGPFAFRPGDKKFFESRHGPFAFCPVQLSSTSVQCYWVKPGLKRVQEDVLQCKKLFKSKHEMGPKDNTVLEEFRNEARKHRSCSRSLLLAYDSSNYSDTLIRYCLFDLMVEFVEKENDGITYEKFRDFCEVKITDAKKDLFSQETKSQVNSKLWHCIRQGRITGSKIYEIAHCKTPNGSLVQELLGGHKVPETKPMKRGKLLEKHVVKKLQQDLKEEVTESGFILMNGVFGASPDGIIKDAVIEIKCPALEKTKQNYINNGTVSSKCMDQVQLQMLAARKNKCLFCVADPNFEQNGQIEKNHYKF